MLLAAVNYYLLVAACLLLGLALGLAAWHRPRRHWRAGRLLASVLAAGALWLTAYPPNRRVLGQAGTAIVLTPGYQPDTLRALRRQLGQAVPVWSYGLPTVPVGARPLGSILALTEQRPALRQLHVLGQGLPTAEQLLLGTLPVQWHAPAPRGIVAAQWSRRLVLGQALMVEGTAAAGSSAPAWVSLRGAGAASDSVRVPAGGGTFQLRCWPRVAGRLLPTLVLRQAGHLPLTEPLPVEVREPSQPPVLLLAAAPGFEFKFLKNRLAATGRAVALRTPVSRGLVQTEAVNQAAQPLDHLTPAGLARYPLVVADAAALAALPAPEAQHLRAAVQAGHLGLVVLAGAGPLPAAVPGRAAFGVQSLGAAAATPVPLTWPDAPVALRAALPLKLRPSSGLRPVVTTAASRQVVVAAHRLGLGTVVVSVVPETFNWALQGSAAGYEAYWNRLLTTALPPPTPAATWQVLAEWPRQNYPLALRLAANRLPAPTQLPQVRALAGGPTTRLALAQDPRLPEWSTAFYWPATSGWHEVHGPGAATQYFFVFDSTSWLGPEQAARRAAWASRATSVAPATGITSGREPWPAGWFFALFVLAAGFLWLEEKL